MKRTLFVIAFIITAAAMMGQTPETMALADSSGNHGILISEEQTESISTRDSLTTESNKTWDYKVLKYIQEHRTPFGNRVWIAVSNSFVAAPLPAAGYAVAALFTDDQQNKDLLLNNAGEMALSEVVNLGLTMGIKSIVQRPRPWVAYEGDLVCLQKVRSTSFPSGHTSMAFATATSLSLVCPKWYVIAPAFLWAGAVGYSRMYIGAHYPSDVLAGALIGTGAAVLVHLVQSQLWQQNNSEIPAKKAVVIPFAISF